MPEIKCSKSLSQVLVILAIVRIRVRRGSVKFIVSL